MEEKRITVDTILDKKFSQVAKGFEPQEVDEFLDEICDEMDRRDAEMNALRKQLAQQQAAKPAEMDTVPGKSHAVSANPGDESFREILEMAKRVKDETIANANAQAKEILANAEEEVRKQLGDLTAQKNALEQQLAELKMAAKTYYEQAQDAMNKLNKLL